MKNKKNETCENLVEMTLPIPCRTSREGKADKIVEYYRNWFKKYTIFVMKILFSSLNKTTQKSER